MFERNTKIFFSLVCLSLGAMSALRSYSEDQDPLFALFTLTLSVVTALTIYLFSERLKGVTLRKLNICVMGMGLGLLLGHGTLGLFRAYGDLLPVSLPQDVFALAKQFFLLVSSYLGVRMLIQADSDWTSSLPFFFSKTQQGESKGFVLDSTVLKDPRLIEVLKSGLIKAPLEIPSGCVRLLKEQSELSDETLANSAKRGLELVQACRRIEGLEVRLAEEKDQNLSVSDYAKMRGYDLIVSSQNPMYPANTLGITVVNLHTLSQALKPQLRIGKDLRVKIQRVGKEPDQGVGYLEDGSMVVVNGGREFLGQTIEVSVISQNSSSCGRMVFCSPKDEAEVTA